MRASLESYARVLGADVEELQGLAGFENPAFERNPDDVMNIARRVAKLDPDQRGLVDEFVYLMERMQALSA